jgi:hypothetical protein
MTRPRKMKRSTNGKLFHSQLSSSPTGFTANRYPTSQTSITYDSGICYLEGDDGRTVALVYNTALPSNKEFVVRVKGRRATGKTYPQVLDIYENASQPTSTYQSDRDAKRMVGFDCSDNVADRLRIYWRNTTEYEVDDGFVNEQEYIFEITSDSDMLYASTRDWENLYTYERSGYDWGTPQLPEPSNPLWLIFGGIGHGVFVDGGAGDSITATLDDLEVTLIPIVTESPEDEEHLTATFLDYTVDLWEPTIYNPSGVDYLTVALSGLSIDLIPIVTETPTVEEYVTVTLDDFVVDVWEPTIFDNTEEEYITVTFTDFTITLNEA